MLTIYQTIPGSEKFTSDVKDLYGTWVLLFKDTVQIIENDSILMAFRVISLPDIAHVENVEKSHNFPTAGMIFKSRSGDAQNAHSRPWVKWQNMYPNEEGHPGVSIGVQTISIFNILIPLIRSWNQFQEYRNQQKKNPVLGTVSNNCWMQTLFSQGIFLEKRVFKCPVVPHPANAIRHVFCLCPPFRRTENPDRLVTSKGPGQLSWRSPTNCWDRWDDDDDDYDDDDDDDDDDDEEEEEDDDDDDDGRCKNSPFGRQTTPLQGNMSHWIMIVGREGIMRELSYQTRQQQWTTKLHKCSSMQKKCKKSSGFKVAVFQAVCKAITNQWDNSNNN